MAKNKIKIEGLDETIKAFARLPYEARKSIEPAVRDGAAIVLNSARGKLEEHGSVISGKLKASLHVTLEKFPSSEMKVEDSVTWGDDVSVYASKVELGHQVRNRKGGPYIGVARAHPFLRPAADENREKVLRMMLDAMNNALDGFGDKK